jgi:hypothetical protein
LLEERGVSLFKLSVSIAKFVMVFLYTLMRRIELIKGLLESFELFS